MPLPSITTSRTPLHGLPYLFPGQTQKEAFVNEAFARLDAVIHAVVRGERVEPPLSPERGDCYIVAAPAIGAWMTQEGCLAVWAETQWLFTVPAEGMRVHDVTTGAMAVYASADGWRREAAPAAPVGGSTQDMECREALNALVAKLHALHIFS